MQSGAKIEAQLLAHEVNDICSHRTRGWLQETPGVLAEMDGAIRFVDDDARRRDPFQHLPMHGCINHGVWRQVGPRVKRWTAAGKMTRHERRRCRAAVRRLLYRLEYPRFPIDHAKEPVGLVGAF